MTAVACTLTGTLTVASFVSCGSRKDDGDGEAKRLNVIYIMCDDHSYQTISAYDSRFIRTPNIDRIADEVTLNGAPFRRRKVFNAMIRFLCPFFAAIILISSIASAFGWISM